MMFGNVVVGSGISGLIYAFYNSTKIIGDFDYSKDNPFVFIQKNRYTDKLLFDLGLSGTIKADYVSVDILDSDSVMFKKIGMSPNDFFGTDKISNISDDKKLSVYCISERELCKYIYEKIPSENKIKGRAVRVSDCYICTDSGDIIEFDNLISTIHFKEFEKICTYWEAGPGIHSSDFIFDVREYAEDKAKIKYERGDSDIAKIVSNPYSKIQGIEYSSGTENSKDKISFTGARFTGKIQPPPKNIFFSGRFSTANPHWRIEDSIYFACRGICLTEIIDEQKRFDKAVVEESGVCGDDRIKTLILGAHSELSELLKHIPWKMHNKEIGKKKASLILEECIDVMKYIFAIMNEFDYTPREIEEMFEMKSVKCWKKFIENFYGGK